LSRSCDGHRRDDRFTTLDAEIAGIGSGVLRPKRVDATLVVSASNYEQTFGRFISSEALILGRAQDERRVEGLRTSV
jgi:hypothetical protein